MRKDFGVLSQLIQEGVFHLENVTKQEQGSRNGMEMNIKKCGYVIVASECSASFLSQV